MALALRDLDVVATSAASGRFVKDASKFDEIQSASAGFDDSGPIRRSGSRRVGTIARVASGAGVRVSFRSIPGGPHRRSFGPSAVAAARRAFPSASDSNHACDVARASFRIGDTKRRAP